MVVLVPPFRSGALYNFCYNAILLYSVFHLHYLHGIGECLNYEEDKLNGLSFGSIRTYFYYYMNIVRLHPAVWNTFIMSAAKLCHDRFVCTELFVY